jgi:hypothetical protein
MNPRMRGLNVRNAERKSKAAGCATAAKSVNHSDNQRKLLTEVTD